MKEEGKNILWDNEVYSSSFERVWKHLMHIQVFETNRYLRIMNKNKEDELNNINKKLENDLHLIDSLSNELIKRYDFYIVLEKYGL